LHATAAIPTTARRPDVVQLILGMIMILNSKTLQH
jgi:hypothetical protein